MALHKLPKHYHPDFRLPNKKPSGSVLIDESSSISKGLKHAFLLNNNFIDLKSGKPEDATFTGSFTGTQKGLVIDTGGGGSGEYLLLNNVYSGTVDSLTGTSFSLTFLVKIRSVSARGGLFSIGANTGDGGVFVTAEDTGNIEFSVDKWQVGSAANARAAYSLNKWQPVTCTYSTVTGLLNIYIDGVAGTSGLNATPQTAKASFGVRLNDAFAGFGRELDGQTALFVSHERALTASEIRLWHKNIGEFLKPKQAPIYFTSDAGGGGGTQQALTLEQVQQLNESGLIGLLSNQHATLETVEQVNQLSLSTLTLNNVIDSIQVEQSNQSNTLSIQQIAGQNLTLEATEQINESNTLTASQLAVITAEITEQVNQSSLGGIVSASAVLLEVTEQQNQSGTININQTDGQLLALVAVEQANETVTVLATQVNSLTLNDSEQVNQSTAISLTQLATLSGSAVEQINQTNLLNIIQTGDLTSLKGIKFEPVSKVFELTEITKTYTLEEI